MIRYWPSNQQTSWLRQKVPLTRSTPKLQTSPWESSSPSAHPFGTRRASEEKKNIYDHHHLSTRPRASSCTRTRTTLFSKHSTHASENNDDDVESHTRRTAPEGARPPKKNTFRVAARTTMTQHLLFQLVGRTLNASGSGSW